jgi:hypothetical protein
MNATHWKTTKFNSSMNTTYYGTDTNQKQSSVQTNLLHTTSSSKHMIPYCHACPGYFTWVQAGPLCSLYNCSPIWYYFHQLPFHHSYYFHSVNIEQDITIIVTYSGVCYYERSGILLANVARACSWCWAFLLWLEHHLWWYVSFCYQCSSVICLFVPFFLNYSAT